MSLAGQLLLTFWTLTAHNCSMWQIQGAEGSGKWLALNSKHPTAIYTNMPLRLSNMMNVEKGKMYDIFLCYGFPSLPNIQISHQFLLRAKPTNHELLIQLLFRPRYRCTIRSQIGLFPRTSPCENLFARQTNPSARASDRCAGWGPSDAFG